MDSFINADDAGGQFRSINNITGSENLYRHGYNIDTGAHDANAYQMQNDTHQRYVPSQSSHNSHQHEGINFQYMTTESASGYGYNHHVDLPFTQHDPTTAGNIILREK